MRDVMVSLLGGGLLGGTYALIGIGLVLVFRATSTLNFAHGQLMLIPAFCVARWQATHDGSTILVIIAAVVLTALISAAFYALVLRRMTGRPLFLALIATFAMAGLLDGVLAMLFGPDQYSLQLSALPSGSVSIAGATLSKASLVLTTLTVVLAVSVVALVRLTPLGLKVRAAGQDALLASQGGINVGRVYIGSWIAAGVLAAVAGIAYGSQNLVTPSMATVALAAFPAILLGGLDSIEGALVGGLIIGVAQGFIATYVGGQYLNVATYGLLLAVLFVRPQGLFGTRETVRA